MLANFALVVAEVDQPISFIKRAILSATPKCNAMHSLGGLPSKFYAITLQTCLADCLSLLNKFVKREMKVVMFTISGFLLSSAHNLFTVEGELSLQVQLSIFD